MMDNIEKCELYLVTLSNKQVKIYVPCLYDEETVDRFMDNTFGETEWHNYRVID